MHCPNCGAPNRETSKFCYRCGIALPWAGTPAGSSPGAAAPSSAQAPRPVVTPPVSAQQSRPASAVPPPVSAQQSRPAAPPPILAQAQPAPGKAARHATQTITFDRLKHKNLIIAIVAGGIFIVVLGVIAVAWFIFQPGKSDYARAQELDPPGVGLFLLSGGNLDRMDKIEPGSILSGLREHPTLKTDQPVFVLNMAGVDNETIELFNFTAPGKEYPLKITPGITSDAWVLTPKKSLDPGLYSISYEDADGERQTLWYFIIE